MISNYPRKLLELAKKDSDTVQNLMIASTLVGATYALTIAGLDTSYVRNILLNVGLGQYPWLKVGQ